MVPESLKPASQSNREGLLPPRHDRFRLSWASVDSLTLIGFTLLLMGILSGLMIDAIIVTIRYETLRNEAENAAITVAFQLSQGRDLTEARATAIQYFALHKIEASSIEVDTCESVPLEAWNLPENRELECRSIRRSLVRVRLSEESVPLFLGIFGIDDLKIRAESLVEIDLSGI